MSNSEYPPGFKLKDLFRNNLPQGGSPTLLKALDPKLASQSGAYLADCVVSRARPHATDPNAAQTLWAFSENVSWL